MGEIGGNDYNNAFFQGDTNLRAFSRPSNNQCCQRSDSCWGCSDSCTRELSNWLHTNLSFQISDWYMKCLSALNGFARYHNDYLHGALAELRREFPNVIILYGDYYNAFESVLRCAPALGV
ncbi:hypothetical protein FRX31_011879 [Thalictrum thalictroides]|uniref:GDSL esterase/lipase n=1 Tax=Thalictrum thalictroides TaxID=46969 RepID=A0A7J6WNN4_THATH|nr:hypothetical protein FRX31_011879 [Thalictrum thalictroides]